MPALRGAAIREEIARAHVTRFYDIRMKRGFMPLGASPQAVVYEGNFEEAIVMLATRIRQKDGIFYLASYPAKDILNKVRFISRYYGEDDQIAPQTVPQND